MMPIMATRKYEQRLRAETAEETRRRILDALYERLRAAPSQPVSIDQVARTAKVARSTVYLIFGLRGGIRGGVQVFAAHRDAIRVLHSMAALDAEAVGGAIRRIEDNRAGGMAY